MERERLRLKLRERGRGIERDGERERDGEKEREERERERKRRVLQVILCKCHMGGFVGTRTNEMQWVIVATGKDATICCGTRPRKMPPCKRIKLTRNLKS